MKISFKTSQQESSWDQILDVWKAADQMEVFEGGWLFDGRPEDAFCEPKPVQAPRPPFVTDKRTPA